MKVTWKNWILTISVLPAIVSCSNINEQGKCLKWHTSVSETRERLPFPLEGEIIREEIITYCISREEKNETALVIRGPTIYI